MKTLKEIRPLTLPIVHPAQLGRLCRLDGIFLYG
jgi:hypothetical protein